MKNLTLLVIFVAIALAFTSQAGLKARKIFSLKMNKHHNDLKPKDSKRDISKRSAISHINRRKTFRASSEENLGLIDICIILRKYYLGL